MYDQNFRQEAAEHQNETWSRVDLGIYAQCFTNMAISTAGWCKHCHAIEHTSEACPICPQLARKRPLQTTAGTSGQSSPLVKKPAANMPVCIKFNRFGGDCRFGEKCRFRHVCDKCGGDYPRCSSPPGKPGPTEVK